MIPQLGLGSMLTGTETYLLDRLDQVVTELGFAEYTTSVRLSTLNTFVYTLSLMIGTAGLPHVIIRFFTATKVSDACVSAGWALIFITILYTTAPAVAAMARLNLHETIAPAAGEQNLAYDERPAWFKNWEKTGLLKFEDKNGDGLITYTADKATIVYRWLLQSHRSTSSTLLKTYAYLLAQEVHRVINRTVGVVV